jgi:tripartite-type tricarboxylate transporter receptor subunit TctC
VAAIPLIRYDLLIEWPRQHRGEEKDIMKLSRWAFALSLAVLLWPASAAAQQAYPNKPIRIITPYVPGGTTTILARLVGQKLTDSWGQSVLVENRPGGNTIIGTDAVAKSAPDGYTLLLAGSTQVLNANLFPSLPYDPIKDFSAVATIVKTEMVLVLNASVPAHNLQEFIVLAKSRPGELNYATPGAGSSLHVATESLNMMVGIKTQHVPYKGAGQAIIDLIGGQVQLYLISSPAFVPHSKDSKLRAIAVTGDARMPALPDVPTFTEAGLAGFDEKIWNGILAPAGTPKPIIEKLATEIARFLAEPEFRKTLVSVGGEPFISTPEQLTELMKADMAKYARIVKAANIKVEN